MTPFIETRRVQIAGAEGLRVQDHALASEVWLDEFFTSTWTTRESMKLAAFFIDHITSMPITRCTMTTIEGQTQLGREEVRRCLLLMQSYRIIQRFTIDRDELNVWLRLTGLQKVRVLEASRRFDELAWVEPAAALVLAAAADTVEHAEAA